MARIRKVLVESHDAAIEPAQAALGNTCARDRRRLEARALREPYAVTIVNARHDENFRRVKQRLELLSFARHSPPLLAHRSCALRRRTLPAAMQPRVDVRPLREIER